MGAIGHDGLAVPGHVDLAHEPPFALGTVSVEPATRQISRDGCHQTLEPRVMQVLVALARAKEAIVTRDELTQWCWEGRIVGEDAINRALSRIRAVAAGIGERRFRVETITKVGYRLLVEPAPPVGDCLASPSLQEGFRHGDYSRRALIGGAALVAASIGVVAWRHAPTGYRPTPEALALYRMGVAARSQGLVATSDQATSYFRQAIRADPAFADAWGALSRQLANGLSGKTDRTIAGAADEATSAARRALALDPRQIDALGTLTLVQARYRRWASYERSLRRFLDDHGDYRPALIELAMLYADVARWDQSIAILQRIRTSSPLLPGPSNLLCLALWSAGRNEEAEIESVRAMERWPRFHGMWFTRMLLLTYGGDPERALAFAANRDVQPSGASAEHVIEKRIATARALISGEAARIADVRSTLLDGVDEEILNAPQAVRFLGAIGDKTTVFELLDAYFRRRGPYAREAMTPIGPMAPIMTDFLFHPTSRIMWDDPRFAALTRDIGLDEYWRSAGFVPAHRRG